MQFIVAEISKNWPDDIHHLILCQRFEDVIAANLQRGYRLHSFTLHRLMVDPQHMNETIIAVFERTNPMHPSIQHVLRFFEYHHLPETLQPISEPFHKLAHEVANRHPENQETTVALRKLLEAKDAAVRAAL